jgi:hypothetical protein
MRSGVLVLAVALVACRTSTIDPRAAASSRASASAPAARATPSAPLSSSAAPVASASASAVAEPEPDDFEKFYDATVETCPVEKHPGTTADMVEHAIGVQVCADRRIRAILARLPAEEQKALTAGPEPRAIDSKSWYPLWSRFIDGACYVSDALTWTRGPGRSAGTMRHSGLPACFSGLTVSALHWLDSYAKKDAAGFARRVRNRAKLGGRAKALQQTLAREAAYFSVHAFEDSTFDDACTFFCPLSDADFRKLTRTLEGMQTAAPELAQAMCRSWLDFARALGGFAPCVETATLFYLAQAGTESGFPGENDGYYEGLAQGKPREPFTRSVPPAKDPDYARFANPLYARCEHDPNHDYLLARTRSACHERELAAEVARASKHSGAAAVRGMAKAIRSYTVALCEIEEFALSGLYVAHERGFTETPCRWLASTRASFLFRTWSEDDTLAFRRHIEHRASWAQRIANELPRLAKGIGTACPKDSLGVSFCRGSWISEATWKRADRDLATLEPQAKKLGEKLCQAWPSLSTALGSACSAKATAYFLSYGQSLGMLSEPER